jgi:hypothetical protein
MAYPDHPDTSRVLVGMKAFAFVGDQLCDQLIHLLLVLLVCAFRFRHSDLLLDSAFLFGEDALKMSFRMSGLSLCRANVHGGLRRRLASFFGPL